VVGSEANAAPTTEELLTQFHALFGKKGGDVYPGNVGVSRTLQSVCHEIMKLPDPVLYDYFDAWNARPEEARKPHNVAFCLVRNGQWEGAWALAQLHYDQVLKQEVKTKSRLHKGHPLCNLAIVAREIGSPTLTRHYALLSSAGDIYWKHKEPDLQHGGYAPTMLEQFESNQQQQEWRKKTLRRSRNAVHGHATLPRIFPGRSLVLRHILAALQGPRRSGETRSETVR
jgi:hypothetical protein